MSLDDKCVVTAAVTGVLTDPDKFNVPVQPEEIAEACRRSRDAGASIIHIHFRDLREGMGAWPTWDLEMAGSVLAAMKEAAPDIIVCMTSGVVGPDISGPAACLEAFQPEMAACNAGSLNYLKVRRDGQWAWPPMLFDNPVEKIQQYLEVMQANNVTPEFECFDTGIVRSVDMFRRVGMFEGKAHLSFVMGVESGMPAEPDLLPILVGLLPENSCWQVIGIGSGPDKSRVWDLHRRALELGGNVRTGLEDTFYLPDGERAGDNARLVEALVGLVREAGREPAGPDEARRILDLPPRA